MNNKSKKSTGRKLSLAALSKHPAGANALNNKPITGETGLTRNDRSAIHNSNTAWFIKICLN